MSTPHQTASTLIAHASPFDLVYQTRSTISGSLLRAFDGAPLPNTVVTVATRVVTASGAFVTRGSVRTDADGRFSFIQAPGISYDYQLSYAGDGDHTATTGATRIRVAHRVSDRLDRASASAGTAVHLTATTAPVLSHGGTYLQRLTNGAITLGPHPTGAQGTVVYTRFEPRHAGRGRPTACPCPELVPTSTGTALGSPSPERDQARPHTWLRSKRERPQKTGSRETREVSIPRTRILPPTDAS